MRALIITTMLPALAIAGPLRQEPFSDVEIKEIQAVVAELYSGPINLVGGATASCACEEGPSCTNQAWVNSYAPNNSKGLQLSKIDGHWVIGRMQRWQLRFDALLSSQPKGATYASFLENARARNRALDSLYKERPQCEAPKK